MDVIQGTGTSTGIAIGPLFFYHHAAVHAGSRKISNVDKEVARFETAKKTVDARYEELYEHTRKLSGEEEAQIFQIHEMMLDDDDFSGFVSEMIRKEQVSAEYAVESAGDHLDRMLKESGDEYIEERTSDVREIISVLLETLSGKKTV